MRVLCLASLLILLGLPAACRADDTLEITLPAINPPAVQQSNQSDSTRVVKEPPRSDAAPNRHGTVNRPANETVIGRLGVTGHGASIHNRRSTRGHRLVEVPAGTYLALTNEADGWYGVLMADKSTGWMLKRDVNVLNYEVVSPDNPDRHQYAGAPAYGSSGQQSILKEAYRYLGVPYKFGGETTNGLDCSSFVQHCYAALGINLPRTAHEQIAVGSPVAPDSLQAADRLYFSSRDGRISHTGIYIGDGYFIHASSSKHGVAVSRLDEAYYRSRFAGARR